MFYVILSSVLLTFFFASGALGLWFTFRRSRLIYAQFPREYIPAYIYFAVALFCFIAACFVDAQIPDCYVP